MQVQVEDILLFTSLFDNGHAAKCCCGFIWRSDGSRNCPSCGRGTHHSVAISVEEYRAARNMTTIQEKLVADESPELLEKPQQQKDFLSNRKLRPSASARRNIAQNPTPLRKRFSSSS